MSKKFFHLLAICISGIFMSPDSAQSSKCSDLQEKCFSKCNEIRLNDILKRECYDACLEAYAQCIKEHPQSAAEDKCDALQQEVGELRRKVHYLENKLNRQGKDKN